jgi:hypothetical protein
MAKLLVLANLELTFDVPEGGLSGEQLLRAKERRLLRLLQQLVAEDPQLAGSLERLEYEGFSYASPEGGEPTGYYYNEHDERERRPG